MELKSEFNEFDSSKLAKIFAFHLLFPIETNEIIQTQLLCEVLILYYVKIFNNIDHQFNSSHKPQTIVLDFSNYFLSKVIQCIEVIELNSTNEILYQLTFPSWQIENFLYNKLNEINVDKSLIASCALKYMLKRTREPLTSSSLYRTLISSNKLSRKHK